MLVPARFISRPNRFIVRARLKGGGEVDAHLGDPGRLVELLRPDAPLRLRPAPAAARRRTRFSVALVRSADRSRAWVSVETARANRLAHDLLARGAVHGVGRGWSIRPEVRRGNSRFDFLLAKPGGRELWVEVKSVTLVNDGVALFPDAPTARGTRHVNELAEQARAGGNALVLFVVQRGDATRVTAHDAIDPAFAAALADARAVGVRLRAAAFLLDPQGKATYLGPLPVRPRRETQNLHSAPAR